MNSVTLVLLIGLTVAALILIGLIVLSVSVLERRVRGVEIVT